MHEGVIASRDVLDSRQFLIAVKRLAEELSYGTDHSRFLGSGVEYVQTRLYQFGDPVKSMDWRVTARTGKPHVKEYEAPKRVPIYLILDSSASMTISSIPVSKYETAVFIAGGLALAAQERISPVGLLLGGERALHVQPTLSRDQVLQWLHHLGRYRYDESTTLSRRLTELVPTLRARSLIVILSDLHDPDLLDRLKLLVQKHDCAVLQLRDPAESTLRGVGFVRAREAETGRPLVARPGARWLDQDQVAATLKRAGIDHLRIECGRPYVAQLRHFFKSRDLLGRGAR